MAIEPTIKIHNICQFASIEGKRDSRKISQRLLEKASSPTWMFNKISLVGRQEQLLSIVFGIYLTWKIEPKLEHPQKLHEIGF